MTTWSTSSHLRKKKELEYFKSKKSLPTHTRLQHLAKVFCALHQYYRFSLVDKSLKIKEISSDSDFTLSTIIFLTESETWYVLESGTDDQGCGRSLQFPCNTILHLLQQVNRTHLPPSRELQVVTDKSLTINQDIAVSTIYSLCFTLGGCVCILIRANLLCSKMTYVLKIFNGYGSLVRVLSFRTLRFKSAESMRTRNSQDGFTLTYQ